MFILIIIDDSDDIFLMIQNCAECLMDVMVINVYMIIPNCSRMMFSPFSLSIKHI